jgi:hypothetical protein
MPFVEIKGLPGKVYVPESVPATAKKNPCPDCFSCQMCSSTRCQICTRRIREEQPGSCTCIQKDIESDPQTI